MSKTNVARFGRIDMKSSNNDGQSIKMLNKVSYTKGVRRRYIGYTGNYDAVLDFKNQ
jgi:hypothetical protein